MSLDDIDLDRVVVDPDYRRQVIEFLNQSARQFGGDRAGEAGLAPAKAKSDTSL